MDKQKLRSQLAKDGQLALDVEVPPEPKREWKWITAMYPGTCDECGGHYLPGSSILYSKGKRASCVRCGVKEGEPWPKR